MSNPVPDRRDRKGERARQVGGRTVLLSFGDLLAPVGAPSSKLRANKVFDALMRQSLWYLPRFSYKLNPGDSLLFYQNGLGVRASAKLKGVCGVGKDDSVNLATLGIAYYLTKLILVDVERFDNALSLKGFVDKLSFIRNKEYWGLSLRSTPRVIPEPDAELIMRHLIGGTQQVPRER